jgi:hypothetical protein
MAKPKLTAITIRPAKGGGHKVTHEFGSAPTFSGSTKNGGMQMDQPPAQEHSFPAGEHNALLNHIATALSLKSMKAGATGDQQGE